MTVVFTPTGDMTSTIDYSGFGSVSASTRCPRCDTWNPSVASFCVTCGERLAVASAASTRSSDGVAARAVDAVGTGTPIATGKVVQVSSSEPVENEVRLVTCARCQGTCDGSMRFCKYCGAQLAGYMSGAPSKTTDKDMRLSGEQAKRSAAPRAVVPGLVGSPDESLPDKTASARRVEQRPGGSEEGNLAPLAKRISGDPSAAFLPPSRFSSKQAPSGAVEGEQSAKVTQGEDKPTGGRTAIARARVQREERAAQPPVRREDREKRAEQAEEGEAASSSPVSAESLARVPYPRVVLIGSNGQDERAYALDADQVDIGRLEGAIVMHNDRYMSPRHCRLTKTGNSWVLQDLGSTNGTYVRIREAHKLRDGDMLLLGVEVLRFELDLHPPLAAAVQHGTMLFATPPLPSAARLVQRTVQGVTRDVYHLHRAETIIGRESGDIVFTDDPYMSKRHASIRRYVDPSEDESEEGLSPPRMALRDLGSSNGTFVAIRDDHPLVHRDLFRVGQHLFRVEYEAS